MTYEQYLTESRARRVRAENNPAKKGAQAFRKGEGTKTNPYTTGTEDYNTWYRGWVNAADSANDLAEYEALEKYCTE